ncbi:MAG: hypothetical protein M3046_04200 [Actinomycetota bacterium]|nr:hypothetical protein [Actinomycetota bacterium]
MADEESQSRTGDEAPSVASKKKAPRWRRALVALFVVVGCVLAPISVIGLWTRNTLLDTNQYVDTVAPLAKDPAIQAALADRVTQQLVASVDIEGELKQAFPPRAEFVVPFIASGFDSFVHAATLRIVQSDRFQTLWENINRRAHSKVLAVLEGTGTETVDTRDGKVVLDVSALIDQVKKTLDDRGITIFDNVGKKAPQEFVLFESEQLTKAQSGVRLLKTLTYVLPFLTLLAFAAAVALSPNRRRTLLRSAVAFAFTMALVLIAFNLARGAYLDAIENAGKSREAGAAAFDQILDFLRVTLRTAFALGLVIAVGAWLAGPGRLATRIREGVVGLVRGGGEGEVTPVGRFVSSYRVPLRILVVGIGLLILVVLSHPGPLAVIVVAVLIVVGLLLIEFLGRTAPRAHAAVGGGTGDGRDT